MSYKDLLERLTDEELSREVATQTKLYRLGKDVPGKLQATYDECERRKNMEIFHKAQEREFNRPITKTISACVLFEGII